MASFEKRVRYPNSGRLFVAGECSADFARDKPHTLWYDIAPRACGFWSNVNAKVKHARWSRATEWLIGTSERAGTLAYSGYAEFVHHLYKGKPWAADPTG